mmetsp:Transcript_9912/g.1556  ORF Transcript_9912/g.1556 Transcript_9912/m.1556 type:complete len:96 (-) Transcript_9912:307-594(-)
MKHSFSNTDILPCTPNSIMTLLDLHNVQLEGKKAVILGKGLLVGYPLSSMLISKYCEVTTLDERDLKDIQSYIEEADIVISAAGVRHLVKGEWIK